MINPQNKQLGRSFCALISIEADKIHLQAIEDHKKVIDEIHAISICIGNKIDNILNNIYTTNTDDAGTKYQSIRDNKTLKHWEATFSVVNMSSKPILYLSTGGYYMQALTLLRQELEGLSQLQHILDGTLKKSGSPNVGNKPKLRNSYGQLSDAAHLASEKIVSLQSIYLGTATSGYALLPHGPSILPYYNKYLARQILELHLEFRTDLLKSLISHIQNNDLSIAP